MMDTMRIISPWIVVAAGLCFAVYMALIDRRMRRLQTPHLDGPTTASGRTEDFRRRHIEEYIAGDISLDDLMEKLRRCGAPKAKLPSPPASAAPSIGFQHDCIERMRRRMIPILDDPFCGAGSLLGSSVLAALLRRGPIGGTSDGIQLPAINIWYRHCDGDGRLLRMMSFHSELYLQDESGSCCAFTDKVVPASPKAGEWWTMRSCAKHGYAYTSDAPSKWQCDSEGTVHMLDRVACGCVAPSNFGKGPSGCIASAVGPSGGSAIAGATGPAGRGAGV
jgi:hypothetical protein